MKREAPTLPSPFPLPLPSPKKEWLNMNERILEICILEIQEFTLRTPTVVDGPTQRTANQTAPQLTSSKISENLEDCRYVVTFAVMASRSAPTSRYSAGRTCEVRQARKSQEERSMQSHTGSSQHTTHKCNSLSRHPIEPGKTSELFG